MPTSTSSEEHGATESEVLQREALESLRTVMGEDDPDLLAMLVKDYLGSTSELLAQMRQALSTQNAQLLRRSAHTLKSTSTMFGAVQLSDHCRTLEDMGRAGTWEGSAEQLARVETEYARVRVALQRLQASLLAG